MGNAGAYSLDDLLVLAGLQGIPQGRLALFLFINAKRWALLLAWPQEVLDERQRLLTLHRQAQRRPAITMACVVTEYQLHAAEVKHRVAQNRLHCERLQRKDYRGRCQPIHT